MKLKFPIRAKMLVYILGTSAIIYIAAILYFSFQIKNQAVNNAKQAAMTYSRSVAYETKTNLEAEMNISRALANSIDQLKILPTDEMISIFDKLLISNLKRNKQYLASWVSWELEFIEPNWNKTHGRMRHIFLREEGQIKFITDTLETEEENYEGEYYKNKVNGLETVVDPYAESYEGTGVVSVLETSVCVPLKVGEKFIGLAGFDLSLERFYSLAHDVEMFKDSYTILVSNNGTIVAHPNKKLINQNIVELIGKDAETVDIARKIMRGEEFTLTTNKDDKTERIYYAFSPITIGKSITPWAMITKVPLRPVYKDANKALSIFLVIGLIGLVLLSTLIWIIARNISLPLTKTNNTLKQLAVGDINASMKLSISSSDEIGDIADSVNSLLDGLNSTSDFAKEIGKGNLDASFQRLSDNDILGESLLDMRQSLINAKQEEEKRKIEDAKQNWATQGIAKFGEILRQTSDNLEDFAYNIISNLVKYVNANQGGLFVINEDDDEEKFIELVSCYAYNRKKYLHKKVQFGEGLIGRCVLEAETIFMTEIPEGYINITSGLGEEAPRCLLIVPLILNEKVYGVLELAAFQKFESHEIDFVEKIGESIASTISNVKINIRTARLLDESRVQAEELAAQEEEMRQNLEELQATQEESARKEAEMSGILAAMNSSLLVSECDIEGKIITINKDFAESFNISRDKIVGRNYKEIARNCGINNDRIDSIWNSLKSNEIVKDIFHLQFEDKEQWINMTFAPIANNEGNIYKVLNIGIDITETKTQEKQVNELVKEMANEKALMDCMMENIPDNIYFKDRESRFLRISSNMLKIFSANDYSQVLGKRDFDFFSEEHAQQAYDDEQKIIKTGEPLIGVVEKETFEDGSVSWVDTTKMPLLDTEGNIIGTFGISRDVTNIKKMELEAKDQSDKVKKLEADLDDSKKLLDDLSKNLPVLVYKIDENKRVTEIRGAGLKLMNLTEEKVIGKVMTDIFPDSEKALEKEVDKQVSFKVIGLYKTKSWELKHIIKPDKHKEGCLVGFAYETKLV